MFAFLCHIFTATTEELLLARKINKATHNGFPFGPGGGAPIEKWNRPVDAGADAETSTIKPGENEFPVSCEAA